MKFLQQTSSRGDGMTKKLRVLSIDGGGIRGVLPARVLVALETKLQTQTSNPDARIADYFDLVAGTSTGGILTCLLLRPSGSASGPARRPQYSAEDALGLYVERGKDIFSLPVAHRIRSGYGVADEKYPATGLETAAREYFGDVHLSELLKPCLVTAYDITRRRAHFFTQHDADRAGKDFFVRDVVRATSAAPTYFECAQIQSSSGVPYTLVDGGVFANNPALCAFAEARNGLARARGLAPAATPADMILLSLGTGQLTRRYEYSEARNWGVLGWARPVIDIMMAGVAETVDYQLRQIFDAFGTPEQYLRLQAELSEDQEDLDNASPENLTRLTQIGAEITDVYDSSLDRFADLLIASG